VILLQLIGWGRGVREEKNKGDEGRGT